MSLTTQLIVVAQASILIPLTASASEIYEPLQTYCQLRIDEFDQIPSERKAELADLSAYLQKKLIANKKIQMTFICTHNSRRSQMAQLWSAVAANYYGVKNFHSHSGGTEATAFNPRAVSALSRAGLKIEASNPLQANPRYLVSIGKDIPEQIYFSKVYDEARNPAADFCAVMTCSSADRNCPNVVGAEARIAIPYEDPKVADDTSGEAAKYDERSAQIAREMLYAFSLINK